MLDFKKLTVLPRTACIMYEGKEYLYTIIRNPDNSLTVHVEDLDDNGDAFTVENYAASALSTAMAIIERLEAGEPE